mgnify:CR=1 FL=1
MIDFDAIKRKLQKLNRQSNRQDVIWKPTGEHVIRLVPKQPDPFIERFFYYFLPVGGGAVSPGFTFGKPDPIKELAEKLRNEGTEEGRNQARTLAPKLRVYAPIIVRGEEDKGVRLWGFGRRVYESLLNTILDGDFKDITDPLEGNDIKVKFTKVTQSGFPDTTITVRPKTSKLCDNEAKAEEWMNNIPDIDTLYELKSYEELSGLLNQWLSGANADNGAPEGTRKTNGTVNHDADGIDDVAGTSEIDNAFSNLLNS